MKNLTPLASLISFATLLTLQAGAQSQSQSQLSSVRPAQLPRVESTTSVRQIKTPLADGFMPTNQKTNAKLLDNPIFKNLKLNPMLKLKGRVGNEGGGGGTVITCRKSDSSAQLTKIELAELVNDSNGPLKLRGRNLRPELMGRSELDSLRLAEKLFAGSSRDLAKVLKTIEADIRRGVILVPRLPFMGDTAARTTTADLTEFCHPTERVSRETLAWHDEQNLFINHDLWNSALISKSTRAATIFHEIVYFMTRYYVADREAYSATNLTRLTFNSHTEDETGADFKFWRDFDFELGLDLGRPEFSQKLSAKPVCDLLKAGSANYRVCEERIRAKTTGSPLQPATYKCLKSSDPGYDQMIVTDDNDIRDLHTILLRTESKSGRTHSAWKRITFGKLVRANLAIDSTGKETIGILTEHPIVEFDRAAVCRLQSVAADAGVRSKVTQAFNSVAYTVDPNGQIKTVSVPDPSDGDIYLKRSRSISIDGAIVAMAQSGSSSPKRSTSAGLTSTLCPVVFNVPNGEYVDLGIDGTFGYRGDPDFKFYVSNDRKSVLIDRNVITHEGQPVGTLCLLVDKTGRLSKPLCTR